MLGKDACTLKKQQIMRGKEKYTVSIMLLILTFPASVLPSGASPAFSSFLDSPSVVFVSVRVAPACFCSQSSSVQTKPQKRNVFILYKLNYSSRLWAASTCSRATISVLQWLGCVHFYCSTVKFGIVLKIELLEFKLKISLVEWFALPSCQWPLLHPV